MLFVGHKTYFTVDENLVAGVSRLTPEWSRFRHQAGSVFLQVAHLADLLGQITPVAVRPFERYDGADATEVMRKLKAWLGAGFKNGEASSWMVGRRLVAGWSPLEMVAFEGLQVPPTTFGLNDKPDGSATVYELWEFDGVLMEMFPKHLSHIPENAMPDIALDSQKWLAPAEDAEPERLLLQDRR